MSFEVWHGALVRLVWEGAKDRKMPGVHKHRIESEVSQDKGQKQHVHINSPG